MERFYITTAIDYVNASPHIGHAYEKIVADVLARFHRLRGDEVYYLTGTDEHGQKNATSAAAAGKEVRAFVDENAAKFRDLASVLNLSINDFIRTTEERHKAGVRQIWERVAAKGDFYKKNYKALYCVGHEAFVTLSDLVDGKCPEHDTEPIVIEEENYFFRLSAYRAQLRALFAARPDFVVPASRAHEMLSLIDTLEDISVSRPVEKLSWGIPVPGDPTHVIYVWFDALTNYITAVGYGSDEERFRRWWPAYHLIGKGINRFHSLLWPAMLISAGIEPPRQVVVHGYLTVEGQKISKSLGNVIHPVAAAEEFAGRAGVDRPIAVDAIRYYLLRDIPFGEDADFSRGVLAQRFNADLANDYGNLLNRSLALVNRHFESRVPQRGADEGGDARLRETAVAAAGAVDDAVARLDFRGALEAIWKVLATANKYLDEEAPWRSLREGKAERAGTILYNVLEAVRAASILLSPWLVTATARAWEQLGIPEPLPDQRVSDAARWGQLRAGTGVRPGVPIFPRIEQPAAATGGRRG
ncbi:MAG TPA: methionine--tRNA ligase [bacterium]|nr:methionine--tRNA ligase [bacterium]